MSYNMPRQYLKENTANHELHVRSIVQTNQLRVKLCNFPLDDQTLSGPASGRGNFKFPAGTPARTATARALSRRPAAPSGALLPRTGRASTSPRTPRSAHLAGARSPTASAALGPELPAGALGLGSSRSRGTRRAAPPVPQSPGAGHTGALCPSSPTGTAGGEEPRRCPATRAPRSAAPGRAPAAPRHLGRALRHRGKLRVLLTEVK